MSDVHRNFLLDFGDEIGRRALEAKARRDALEKSSPDFLFEVGRSQAYYEVVSYLIRSADVHGISSSELRLAGLDPDRDLL